MERGGNNVFRPGKEILIFDGGMGSELERAGILAPVPEDLNLDRPELVARIHRSYACADVITTNTFGLNRIKYRGKYRIADVAAQAVRLAREAGKRVFFDIGPTGALLAPLGTLSFDEAYDAFREVVLASRELADGYILETFSDLYEIKAALLAVKENSALPVFATMTFDANGRTLTGSSPEIVVRTLEGLGADAVGVNCSSGPEELRPVVSRMLACAHGPVIVQPNRGVPVAEAGGTRYPLSEEAFERAMRGYAADGVAVLGGCCGTTPACIRRIADLSGRPVAARTVPEETSVCSARMFVKMDRVVVCGERLNPTGKKRLREALLAGDFGYLADVAMKETEAGAQVLDVNVGVPGIDEAETMRRAIAAVQEYSDAPVQIDSSDLRAVEAGARYCCGVPLINSVNGERETMERVFPVAAKYGAVVLGLTMDGRGVPATARERVAIAEKIVQTAEKFGIPRRNVMIDTLTLTASAEQSLVRETLEAVRLVKSLGVKIALGVSNVSYGLPDRPLLNRTFLAAALAAGLDMPIMDPLDGGMTETVRAFAVLSGEDGGAENYIRLQGGGTASPPPSAAEPARTLADCVKRGLKEASAALVREETARRSPLEISDLLAATLEKVGAEYERGVRYLPQLVASAEAAKEAFSALSAFFAESSGEKKGTVVLATVRGDVHDIGKNIVKVVAESYGYRVVDLGKDVPAEEVVAAEKRHRPIAVGLSALMTTTVKSMAETVEKLRAAGCRAKIFVGGAVLNAETAARIGADYYTKNALEFVKKLGSL